MAKVFRLFRRFIRHNQKIFQPILSPLRGKDEKRYIIFWQKPWSAISPHPNPLPGGEGTDSTLPEEEGTQTRYSQRKRGRLFAPLQSSWNPLQNPMISVTILGTFYPLELIWTIFLSPPKWGSLSMMFCSNRSIAKLCRPVSMLVRH